MDKHDEQWERLEQLVDRMPGWLEGASAQAPYPQREQQMLDDVERALQTAAKLLVELSMGPSL
jgi:hypothetical protein